MAKGIKNGRGERRKQSNGNGFGNFNLERAVEKELAYLQKIDVGVIWLDKILRFIEL
ncbi:MAG: hypothetical protein ACYTXT_32835 [Nostoc sp.]